MEHRRDVQLAELLVERIPVAVRQGRRLGPGVLVGVGVQQAAHEAQVLHAALQLRQGDLDGQARHLGQPGDAAEQAGVHPHLLGDDVVEGLVQPLDDLGRPLGVHQLEWPRRQELHVGAVSLQLLDVAVAEHASGVQRRLDLLVGELAPAPPVRSARGQQARLVGVEPLGRGDVAVDVDDHVRSSGGFSTRMRWAKMRISWKTPAWA